MMIPSHADSLAVTLGCHARTLQCLDESGHGIVADASHWSTGRRAGEHRVRVEATQHLQALRRGATLRLPLTHQEEVMTMIVVAAASAGSTRV
jgi:hypothetical protein